MKVELRNVADKGDFDKERLILAVVEDTDIGRFSVYQTAMSSDGGPTVSIYNAFWCPDKRVSKGDLVVLYSKEGKANEKIIDDATQAKAHFFYWGLSGAIWEAEDTTAVVLYSPEWRFKKSTDL